MRKPKLIPNVNMNITYSKRVQQYQRYGAQQTTVSNAEALKRGLQEYGVKSNLQVFEEAQMRSGEIDQNLWGILGRINSEQTRADILRKKLGILNVSPIPDRESETVEFKAGIQAVPNSPYSRIVNGGLKLIFSELAGMYNAKGEGSLYVGISDSTRKPTALEDQLSLLYPTLYSRDRVESTLLYNVGRAWTANSTNFLQSLSYHWFLLDSHLILRIDVKKTVMSDIVLVNPHSWGLPIRCGTSLTILRGYDMLNWVRSNNKNNQ
jgi:hypothetical protein